MNKQQKEILQSQLNSEKAVIDKLKAIYKKSLNDINDRIAALKGRTDTENLQSIIYQVQYQEALKGQINGILDTLNGEQYATISDYLTKCYEDGFIGTMYDLQKQGVPFVFPIDQNQVVMAIQHDTKLSKPLYNKLGEDVDLLKQRIANNISRGIAQNSSYADISKNIVVGMVGDYSKMRGGALGKAYTIARTEGHRITQEATHDAQKKAKDKGADIVKQWDSTLDKRTRPHHAQLDGQIRELDEPFEVAGRKALYPGGFGVPGEDIHCRCVVLQRAKIALDDEELEELKKRAEYYGLDKSDSFEDFKQKYIEAEKPPVITKPFEGKAYHLSPHGDLIEGEDDFHDIYNLDEVTSDKIATADAYNAMQASESAKIDYILNPDGTITPLKSIDSNIAKQGKKYKDITYTLNDDGTFVEGAIKNQAQYKIDVDGNKVLNVDVTEYVDNFPESFQLDNAKTSAILESLPPDMYSELEKIHDLNPDIDDSELLKSLLQKNGYDAVHAINTNTATQDLLKDFVQVFDDDKITKTKKSKIETLTSSLGTQQKKLSKIDNKTYSGIWYKQDVNVSDYPAYKDKIQAKKEWYSAQIASGTLDEAKKIKFQQHLDDLDEFEKLGAEYEAINSKIKKINGDINKLKPKTAFSGGIGDFSDERKANAKWFDNKNGGFKAADKYFDPPSKPIHSAATKKEHDGFYTYTSSSGGHNRPLAGFEKPWSQSGTGWEEQFYKGAKKVNIDFEGKGSQIRGLTDLISKSTYEDDVWLQSGQGFSTIEGFLGIKKDVLSRMTDDELQQFVGRNNTIYNFISSAVNKGGGSMFNSKPLKINFYAPKGSQMLYASDVGAYGKGENEMILQRGGNYTITKIYWGKDDTDYGKRKIFVDMEIHPEKGYDLFQQDPNEWTGSKKNYKD